MFTEGIYYIFLVLTAFLYRFCPAKFRPVIIAVSAVIFYAFYAGAYIFLLLALTFVSWAVLFNEKTHLPVNGKTLAGAGIVVFIGILCYFKYRAFVGSIFGLHMAKVAAPLAISFFAFEFIHITAEKRKGTIDRIGFWRYFAFIFFYPTMVAGPIKRYGQFEKSLDGPNATWSDVFEGLYRILIGLFLKLVLADNINSLIMEIGIPSRGGKPLLWAAAVFLYGFRIYWDFAGYSHIAIGSSRLLGIHIPENFLAPYRQRNIAAFWRNWHVSLSSWLTDYVYIPLGGSRKGPPRTLANLFATMLVSGIWHGAAWNFVLWGVWHGVMLVGHKMYTDRLMPLMPRFVTEGPFSLSLSYAATMFGVWFGWALFMWPTSELTVVLHRLLH